ncbi:GntR family transcriptional regulator [Planctomicrobium sp. SH664]|uniref:GntR family transcriptional regulator n=1 Tax=Planctomicrobium sp. SH664 TaxID=3448125 RepID=UPI003F5B9E43
MDAVDTLPKHEQLRAWLIRELREGRIRPGGALPTEHALAETAQVSRNTVRQALAGLENAGMIRRIPGRGTFIHEDALKRLNAGVDIFALLVPDTRSGFYPSLLRGFQNASSDLRLQVIVSDTENDPHRQADTILQLLDQKIAGIAIVPTTIPATPAHQIRPLQDRGVPVVCCHRPVEGIQSPLVTFSPALVGEMAARALREAGHRRVAFLGAQRTPFTEAYENALRETLAAGGGIVPREFVFWDSTAKITPAHERFVEQTLTKLLQHPEPPTAIFTPFDSEAELIYVLLNRMGVSIPDQMSLIGFGGTWREGAITSRLVSVAVDEEELGRTAVRLLSEMRSGARPLFDQSVSMMPLTLSAGSTLAPPAR